MRSYARVVLILHSLNGRTSCQTLPSSSTQLMCTWSPTTLPIPCFTDSLSVNMDLVFSYAWKYPEHILGGIDISLTFPLKRRSLVMVIFFSLHIPRSVCHADGCPASGGASNAVTPFDSEADQPVNFSMSVMAL